MILRKMTLEEERLRYEAAMQFAEAALNHIHAAYNGSNKLLMLLLAKNALIRAGQFMGEMGQKIETSEILRTKEFEHLLQMGNYWNERLARLKEAKPDIIQVKFN